MGKQEPETPLAWQYLVEELRSIQSLIHPQSDPFLDQNDFLRPVPLLLASAWEVYAIRSAQEAAVFLGHFTEEPESLPKGLKLKISKGLKEDKHELSVWELAGEGWKKHIADRAKVENRRLRSGKPDHVDEHIEYAIGLAKVSSHWRSPRGPKVSAKKQLLEYIQRRDKIIHQGDIHLSREECWSFYGLVEETAIRTAHAIDKHIHELTGVRYYSMSMKMMRDIATL